MPSVLNPELAGRREQMNLHVSVVKTETQRGKATKEERTQSGLGFLTLSLKLFLFPSFKCVLLLYWACISLYQLSFQYCCICLRKHCQVFYESKAEFFMN
jgi:hypothetical protein